MKLYVYENAIEYTRLETWSGITESFQDSSALLLVYLPLNSYHWLCVLTSKGMLYHNIGLQYTQCSTDGCFSIDSFIMSSGEKNRLRIKCGIILLCQGCGSGMIFLSLVDRRHVFCVVNLTEIAKKWNVRRRLVVGIKISKNEICVTKTKGMKHVSAINFRVELQIWIVNPDQARMTSPENKKNYPFTCHSNSQRTANRFLHINSNLLNSFIFLRIWLQ